MLVPPMPCPPEAAAQGMLPKRLSVCSCLKKTRVRLVCLEYLLALLGLIPFVNLVLVLLLAILLLSRFNVHNSFTNLQRCRPMSDDDDGAAKIAYAAQHLPLGLGIEG